MDGAYEGSSGGSEPPREESPGPPAWKDLIDGEVIRVTGMGRRSRPRHDAEQEPPESLALTSKFSFNKQWALSVLGTAVEGSHTESGKLELAPEEAKRADEVAMPTENQQSVGSRKVVNNNNNTTTTTGSDETTMLAGKSGKNKDKKLANKSAPLADDDAAALAKSADAAKEPKAGTGEKWALIWRLLESSRDMVEDKANHEEFKRMLSKTMATTSPVAAKGPVCANPVCGKFGHTLAVCPVPTDSKHGDMTGCFFCNVVEHDADDCPMMEWVSPATLVTHLITNRAGMPPWNTRIDWVALALSEWDLVCFTMLPLTRAFVKKVYIPGRCWKEVNGVSPITEPILKNADRKLLKDLARKAKPGDSRPRRPLMEASVDMCYCRNKCHDDIEHTVFKNEALQKFIPDMNVDEETYRKLMAVYEREVAATQAQMTKKMPKKVTKERKGRRAMKKEAMAAAAAVGKEQHAVAGPTVSKTALTGSIDQAGKDDSSEEEENEKEIPVSQSLLDLTDAVDEVIKNIQKIVKS